MSSLFIVRVHLSQTVDDSYYVYKWVPWSNLPMSLLFIVRVLISQTVDDTVFAYVVAME